MDPARFDHTFGHRIAGALMRGEAEEAARAFNAAPLEARETFAPWCVHHRLASILYEAAPADSPIREILKDARREDVATALLRKEWTAALLRALNDAGATPIVFKGLGMAHDAAVYPQPDMRPLGDLDLWIRDAQMPAAIEAARAQGFEWRSDDPAIRDYFLHEAYDVQLTHPRHGLLELHRGYHRDLPDDTAAAMRARTEPAEVLGVDVERFTRADLLVLLVQHFAIQPGPFFWNWLWEIHRLASTLNKDEWLAYRETTLAAGHPLFAVAAQTAWQMLWGLAPPAGSEAVFEALDAQVLPRERAALDNWTRALQSERLEGDKLTAARRISGRPIRGGSRWRSVFCHPGVVCLEMKVRSDAAGFWWQRLKHAAQRMKRAAQAM